MRRLVHLAAAAMVLCAGCADPEDSIVLGGFLLGLPDPAPTSGLEAELTVFLGRGLSPLEVASNTIQDADSVVGAASGVEVAVPHVADGFYITHTDESPALAYRAEPWTVSAAFDGRQVEVQFDAPGPAALFGAPLDGTWTVDTPLTLSLPDAGADRGFVWVNGPDGEVSWTDEALTTGELLRWLDSDEGYPEALIPGEAFAVPGQHRVVTVAAVDAGAEGFLGVGDRSRFSAGVASVLLLEVQ
ncbi:MAG: hypothetical protein KDA24_21365 [Deltaproteobacteria bacterium]|nr:hypothetical protein [Deltaproteobacteria bacterium]